MREEERERGKDREREERGRQEAESPSPQSRDSRGPRSIHRSQEELLSPIFITDFNTETFFLIRYCHFYRQKPHKQVNERNE